MEPVKSSTYVKAAEAFRSDTGRVTFVKVELGTGHSYLAKPEDAPVVGDQAEVAVTFTRQPALLHVVEGQ